MNEYQKFLIRETKNRFYLFVKGEQREWLEYQILEKGQIVFEQDEDITIKDYALYIYNTSIEAIFALKGKKQTQLTMAKDPKRSIDSFFMNIDFEQKKDAIKIVFKDNLADDLIIPIVYKEADKEAYYAKQREMLRKELLSKASVRCATGESLVNIYFQPCCENYGRTEVALYLYQNKNMLARYKVDPEIFFCAIDKLAYGGYEFVLKQFDDKENLIFETDRTYFRIEPHSFGRGVVSL